MLSALYADNFRCLVNFQARFHEIALLLGQNGTGKSTIFEVLGLVRDFVTDGAAVSEIFPGSTLTKWMKSSVQSFRLEVQGPEGPFEYRLDIEHHQGRGLARVGQESLDLNGRPLFHCSQGEVRLYRDDHSEGPQYPFDWKRSALASVAPRHDNERLTWFKEYLARIVLVSLRPQDIGADAGGEDRILDRSGGNFANWYRFLSQEHQDRIFDLTDELREVLPGFRSFRLAEAGRDHRTLRVIFAGESGELEYDFDGLSDGQRALIILYTMLYGLRGLGYTLAIDEPENFLALPEIQPWLMELKDACGDGLAQAVLISHHPELIDYLAVDSKTGIWLERTPNGATRVGRAPRLPDAGLKLSEVVERGWETQERAGAASRSSSSARTRNTKHSCAAS